MDLPQFTEEQRYINTPAAKLQSDRILSPLTVNTGTTQHTAKFQSDRILSPLTVNTGTTQHEELIHTIEHTLPLRN